MTSCPEQTIRERRDRSRWAHGAGAGALRNDPLRGGGVSRGGDDRKTDTPPLPPSPSSVGGGGSADKMAFRPTNVWIRPTPQTIGLPTRRFPTFVGPREATGPVIVPGWEPVTYTSELHCEDC